MDQPALEEHLTDLKLAAAVQDALLTADLPQCHCGRLVLRNRMSNHVGGDFYHVRPLGDDQLVFAIGDVAGHGIGAALVMALILGYLRQDTPHTRRPSALLAQINELLLALGRRTDSFITCSLFYGIVDLPTGIVIYVNAGHPHPLLCHRTDANLTFLPPTTMLLGVQQAPSAEACHQFRRHDRLILYTDGITEAASPQARQFGHQNLESLIRANPQLPPEQLADAIFAALDDHTRRNDPADDQTLAIIDFDHTAPSI
jgi:sigma-B regulation protein RsbU (phosphoserine phosphatase)